ncbi:MAG TPA: hypothetical protein VI386_24890 [Candidatus Sulfotelmatobacter sp.]
MSEPLAVANLALSLLGKTTDALNALRERSQRSKDLDIKDQISTMYDNVLQLKEVVSRLLDENKGLQRQLAEQQHPPEKPKIKQVGQTNYYFIDKEGPYCQPCYDKTKTLVVLLPPKRSTHGGLHRDCPVCHTLFWESPNSDHPTTYNSRSGPWS